MANRLVKSLFCAAIAFASLFTTSAFASFDENAPYLTFHSPSEFSISATKRWNGKMAYPATVYVYLPPKAGKFAGLVDSVNIRWTGTAFVFD